MTGDSLQLLERSSSDNLGLTVPPLPEASPKSFVVSDDLNKMAQILIVDDEPVNIKVVRKYLSQAGYENFLTTTDSSYAADLIREELPDVILLDVMMPEVSGLEILETIKSHEATAYIPVIILTASSDTETKSKALKLGATDFLTKPVDTNDLLPRVRNVLNIKAYQDKLKNHSEMLEQEVRKRTADLARSRLEVIHCLGRAAEYRDNETGRHVIRVGRYAGVIARELNLDKGLAELIEHAAPLHDVGKIGIPDSILLKPGKLTPEEFEVMMTHARLGHNVFKPHAGDSLEHLKSPFNPDVDATTEANSPLLEMAARIALTHHERWDGTGYPLGLLGEDIPIEGRITAVADVFDALSNQRPYKLAYPLKTCLSIMENERGTQFDPAILDAFLACRDEIVEIQISLTDAK